MTCKRALLFTCVAVLIFAIAMPGLVHAAAQPTGWHAKVDPLVMETAAGGNTEFILFLAVQADLRPAVDLQSKREKGSFVYTTLTAVANRTQGPILRALQALGVEHRPYWVANMIWVRAGLTTIEAMARRPDVAHVYANPRVPLPRPDRRSETYYPRTAEAIEWNISQVNAPAVWAAGFTGQGAVIGGQDTGYQWDHPALIESYRGWNGTSADHDYNRHDAIHSSNSHCGADSPFPCDDDRHGTHTMGTMVGDDGGPNQIGMAPGARWIGCRNMEQGVGTPITYSECYQWFIAPTRIDGSAPLPAMAPDVINNSWACPPSEGCTNPAVLLTVVNNVRAAGIMTVHAAGNEGSRCSTVANPAAIYAASFAVGATDSRDAIAGFSSRGPVTIDNSGRLKPDIAEPGVGVRSSVPGNGYQGGWFGTSMAAPHVAGLVALLIAADPTLKGKVSFLEDLISQSALPLTTNQGCGGDAPDDVPNNVYGWGRIDAHAAYLDISSTGPCPVTRVLEFPTTEENRPAAETLSILRSFRDLVLARTAWGRHLIALYYQHGPEISHLVAAQPDIRRHTLRLLSNTAPAILKAVHNGGSLTLEPDTLAEIHALIESYASQAGIGLVDSLTELQGFMAGHSYRKRGGRTVIPLFP